MSRRLVFFLAASLAVASSLRAEDGPEPPKAPAPHVVSVISVTDETLLYREHVFIGPIIPRRGEKPPEGHAFVVDPVYGPRTAVAVRVPLKHGVVYDLEGKKVGMEEVRKRLKAGDLVIVSMDYKKVDPAYLKAFAKDMLILVPPVPPAAPVPPFPPPGRALPKPPEKNG